MITDTILVFFFSVVVKVLGTFARYAVVKFHYLFPRIVLVNFPLYSMCILWNFTTW